MTRIFSFRSCLLQSTQQSCILANRSSSSDGCRTIQVSVQRILDSLDDTDFDLGSNRCRVDFKKSRTVNTFIQIKVISKQQSKWKLPESNLFPFALFALNTHTLFGSLDFGCQVPPEEPIIQYRFPHSSQVPLKGMIGTFNEGDKLVLVCLAMGGKPRPSLTWWRDYTIIDDTFEYPSKHGRPQGYGDNRIDSIVSKISSSFPLPQVATNELTLFPLARHHLLSIFTCQASNNNITIASSASISIDLNCKPSFRFRSA